MQGSVAWLVVFSTWFTAVAASLVWAVVAGIRMLFHFKDPADRYSGKTLWNPLNALVMPHLLTEQGLRLRRHVGRALLTALCCWLAGAIFGAITVGFR
jgi:hypothetical protein